MKKYFNYILIIASLALFSCSDWLDIGPKSEIKTEDNFTDEQGFKDALTGVYIAFTKSSLYGRDLSYGLVDVLGRQYTQVASSTPYYYLSSYDYTDQNGLDLIDNVWSAAYNAIANINLLIENIEEADGILFTGTNRQLIRGEAYALRAMISFDLLRLFGPAFSLNSEALGIPYVITIGKELTPFSTVSKNIEAILKDLQIAEEELKYDPVNEERGEMDDDEAWIRDRAFKLNYYATKLLKARVLLYSEEYEGALGAAQSIIDQQVFTWTPSSEITTTTEENRNRIFNQEVLFGLHIPTLLDDYDDWFNSPSGFYKDNYYWEQTFEISLPGYSGDYRFQYLTYFDPAAYVRYSTKLKQPESNMLPYARKLPLMRLSEAYYIASEALFNITGVSDAIPYLNEVRARRNIMVDIDGTISGVEYQEELLKEYMKEFIGEGQLFYFYKRHNYSSINYYFGVVTPETYTLPIPLEELANR